jgi:hypothetical protein
MGLTSTTKLVTATVDPEQVDVSLLTGLVRSGVGRERGDRSRRLLAVGQGHCDRPTGVRVTVITGSHQGVLAVPVGALVVVQGGGYAVQVVTGSGSRLVGVRTAMFADGMVEVSEPASARVWTW